MGWINSLLGKSPLSERRIAKVVKLVTNPYAQPDVRMREMQRLIGDGSDAALRAVLKRFGVNANGSIADEDEKQWLEDAMVEQGQAALTPLRAFIGSATQITYALRAYHRIAGDDEAVRVFLDVLDGYGPDDHRAAEAKLQLVWHLSDALQHPRVLPALLPFLQDHSDDVRWAVLDCIEKAQTQNLPGTDAAALAEAMAPLITDDATAPRIQQRAAALLADNEWPLPPASGQALTDLLGPDYFVDKKNYVRRRAKKKRD